MLRIFKTAINTPLVTQSNTCNCVYVMSRSFARRKKEMTPREMQEMGKLWAALENTPFGKQFSDHLEKQVVGKGMDEHKIMEAVFGLKPSKQQMREAAKKKPTNKKDDKADEEDPTAGLEEKEADLTKIGINNDFQAAFAQEMNRMSGTNDPLGLFAQMNDLHSVLQAAQANAEAREAQAKAQTQAQVDAAVNPQNSAKSSAPAMPEGKSSKNDEGMKRVQRELSMMRKQKSSKKQDK